MPSDQIELPLRFPAIPEGFCSTLGPNWIQDLANLFATGVAVLNTGSGAGTIVLNQENLPTLEQRGFMWYQPSTGRLYTWDAGGGAWVSPHPSEAGGIERKEFEGTPAQIWAVEGGDGTDPSLNPPARNSGAMWEIDPAYTGRSSMSPGLIPGSDPAKTLALSEDYGAGSHAQTEAEMFPHSHPYKAATNDNNAGFPHVGTGDDDSLTFNTESRGGQGSPAAASPMLMVHPVHGVYKCKRTARVNYVGSGSGTPLTETCCGAGAGDPNGTVTGTKVGQVYLNTLTNTLWSFNGTVGSNTGWVSVSPANFLAGNFDPNGLITGEVQGQTYLNMSTATLWSFGGTVGTNTGWT